MKMTKREASLALLKRKCRPEQTIKSSTSESLTIVRNLDAFEIEV